MTLKPAQEHRVELPSAVKVHTIKHLLGGRVFFPQVAPRRITPAFHPRYSQFEPFAIAMLAAWAEHWKDQGVEVVCENQGAKGLAYAQRMGLFRFLPAGPIRRMTWSPRLPLQPALATSSRTTSRTSGRSTSSAFRPWLPAPS